MVSVRVGIPARPEGSYPVLIGRRLLADLPGLLAREAPAARYAVIADAHVAPLYAAPAVTALRAAGLAADLLDFPAGELSKTRDNWAVLTDRMLALECHRDAVVVAVGGGVTGDLAGFVAATYLRGVPLVQVPTTLLAMVDSAIGGKTGVDAAAGKNLIGAFHQPRLVVADLDTLDSLPPRQRRSGLGEVVKYGVVADAAFFDALERDAKALAAGDPAATERVVRRSAEIKALVVGRDAEDVGQRSILNFGHTIGHALEAASGFTLLHGEAVAIGMVCEARLAERIGIAPGGTAERIERAVGALGLPVARPADAPLAGVLSRMRLDKKTRASAVRFALPSRIGAMQRSDDGQWTVEAPDDAIREVLGA